MKKPSDFYCCICGQPLNDRQDLFVKIRDNDSEETLRIVPVHSGNCDNTLCKQESAKGNNTIPNFISSISSYKSFDFKGFQHTYFCKWAI